MPRLARFSFKAFYAVAAVTVSLASAYAGERECEDAYQTAQAACNTPSMTAGMNPQQQMQAQQLQQAAATGNANVQALGAQMAAQCKNQMEMGKIMSAMSTLKGGACIATIAYCKSACSGDNSQPPPASRGSDSQTFFRPSAATTASSRMKSRGNSCLMFSINGAASLVQAGMMMKMNEAVSEKCAQMSAMLANVPTGCANPIIAKDNPMCICERDPKNAMCKTGDSFPVGISTSNGPIGPSTLFGSASDMGSDGSPTMKIGDAKAASGSATAEGGVGGGGLGGKGGLQSVNSKDSAPPASNPKSVITGVAGGGGGAEGGGGGGARGPAGGTAGSGFNFKDQLPKMANRSIAGMSVPAVHGITGPLGPSIFEKVTGQYQQQKRNMIQDR